MSSATVRVVLAGAATGLAAAGATTWVVNRQPEQIRPRAAAPAPRHVRAPARPRITAPARPRVTTPEPAHVHGVLGTLPASALRGPTGALQQYPTPSLATPAQRAGAVALLAQIRLGVRAWSTARRATAAGFVLTPVRHTSTIGYLHAESHRFSHDDRFLDPRRPEALIYANGQGSRTLVGAMFSMPRSRFGPNPGGPITRWHTHRVCVRGLKRGLTPRPDGTCPPGTRAIQGSEMLHVWFTRDLRSAFAIHAPEPELCRDRLLPAGYCHALEG